MGTWILKRWDTKEKKYTPYKVDLGSESLVPKFEKYGIIPKAFEQKEWLANKIATHAIATFLKNDKRFGIREELALLKDLKRKVEGRVDNILRKIENLLQATLPESIPPTLPESIPQSYFINMKLSYERVLQEEKKFIEIIDSKLRMYQKLRDNDEELFRRKQPQQFILDLHLLFMESFPRKERKKKYHLRSSEDWISKILKFYDFTITPKKNKDAKGENVDEENKEIDADYVRRMISRSREKAPEL